MTDTMTAEQAAEQTLTDTAAHCYMQPREAAAEIIRLREKLSRSYAKAVLDAKDLLILTTRAEDAEAALKPFAALADVCDYFRKMPEEQICSWRRNGKREKGPTADDCRFARRVLLRAKEAWSPSVTRPPKGDAA